MHRIRSYVELLKIRIVALVLWTVWVGMRVAAFPEGFPVGTVLLGVGLAAAGAAALNHWMDRDVDTRMARTRGRPVPAGIVAPAHALKLGGVMAGIGVGIVSSVSWKAGVLTGLTVLLYTPVYTWYKRRSPYSAVLGSLIGALPPAIGVVAVQGRWTVEATLLAALLFLWQPAHFWALARMRERDYAQAGIPVLPVARGHRWTHMQMVLYAASLLPVTALFPLVGMVNPPAGGWILGLTLGLLGVYVGILYGKTPPHRAFRWSTLYLVGALLPLAL